MSPKKERNVNFTHNAGDSVANCFVPFSKGAEEKEKLHFFVIIIFHIYRYDEVSVSHSSLNVSFSIKNCWSIVFRTKMAVGKLFTC